MQALPSKHSKRRCPRCGSFPTGGEDFQSGIYEREGRLARVHAARYTLRCLDPRCQHSEVVYDRTTPDDVWLVGIPL